MASTVGDTKYRTQKHLVKHIITIEQLKFFSQKSLFTFQSKSLTMKKFSHLINEKFVNFTMQQYFNENVFNLIETIENVLSNDFSEGNDLINGKKLNKKGKNDVDFIKNKKIFKIEKSSVDLSSEDEQEIEDDDCHSSSSESDIDFLKFLKIIKNLRKLLHLNNHRQFQK